MSEKACVCRREINHLHSMGLLLMEAMGDKRYDSAKFYKGAVEDAVKTLGKCTKADMSRPLGDLEKIPNYIEQGDEGTRPILRVLEDMFWIGIHNTCVPKEKRVKSR